MKNIFSLLLLSLIFLPNAIAEFDILEINDIVFGCDGSVRVLADGSAGPFEIKIIDSQTQGVVATKENVSDITVFENLCAGSYDHSRPK